jgi:hypothetical protein
MKESQVQMFALIIFGIISMLIAIVLKFIYYSRFYNAFFTFGFIMAMVGINGTIILPYIRRRMKK